MSKIKINKSVCFFIGVAIFLILLLSFFVKIKVEDGLNYITYDTLLGILIFHNPFVLGIYVLIVVILIVKSLSKK